MEERGWGWRETLMDWGSVLFCSVSVWLDAGLFKNTVIPPLRVKKLTTRPSTSAYEHSAGGGLRHRLPRRVSDWRWNNRTPQPPGTFSTAILLPFPVFGRLRRSKWLPAKVDRTLVYSSQVKLFSKDGLYFPPLAE
jgi:hypothetical protein